MTEIRIEVFKANRGDCMLVSCEGETTTNILIDLGVEATYQDCVQKRLEELHNRGEHLDLLVLTHVDDDHIGGAKPFLEDNRLHGSSNKISVRDVWLNSYRHLSHERTSEAIDQRARNSISRQIVLPSNTKETEITAEDGTTVAGMLYKYHYPWNCAFNGQAVITRNKPVIINQEVKITVLTPTVEQITALEEVWLEELEEKFPEIKFNNDKILDDAVFYASYYLEDEVAFDDKEPISRGSVEINEGKFSEDPSVINASSITFILEFLNKRILFLADSSPSTLLRQLQALYPEMSPEQPLYFDAVKVSHHGSKRNTCSEFMKHISSERFIFSASGRYGHPHMETVSRILLNSSCTTARKLYFNYETSTSKNLLRDDWMDKYRYSCHIGEEIIRIPTDSANKRGENNEH
ncbi:MBL fold metallo-hydrolase [Priestia megaterium]|uniref:MBL fold metallo-hydrolase n=1 Tax=Priestia megaterium TaxID=1404 RepID=UPI003EE2EB6C